MFNRRGAVYNVINWTSHKLLKVKLNRNPFYSLFLLSIFFTSPDFSFSFTKILWDSLFSPKNEIAASLEINKIASVGTVPSGETFTYTIQYRCASLTDDCLGTVITDPLPSVLEFVGMTGSVHTTSENYNSGSHTVTFDFVDPLPAGTSGQVQIQVRFPNGTTPNGTVSNNTATISASNATSASNSASVTASAQDRLATYKYFIGGVLDEITGYGIQICSNTENGTPIENGTLNPTNLTVVDALPAGSIFDSANAGGVYNASNHTVTWTNINIPLGECWWPQVFVVFPSSTFNTGDVVTNNATVTYTPVGETPISVPVSVDLTFVPADVGGYLNKSSNDNSVVPGQSWTHYSISWYNWSNVSIDGFYLEDTIPDYLNVTRIDIGNFYVNGPYTTLEKTVSYTTNLNSTLTTVPGSPFNLWDNTAVYASSLGLAANEYITKIRWDFGPDPMPISAGMNSSELIRIHFEVDAAAPPGPITNCMEVGGTTAVFDIDGGDPCEVITVETIVAAFKPGTRKDYASPQCGGCWSYNETGDWISPGETISMRIRLRNSSTAGAPMPNPAIADLFPIGMEYVSGSWAYDDNGTGIAAPSFTETPNYNGSGRLHLRWDWLGVDLDPDEDVWITFDVLITTDAPIGEDALTNKYAVLSYDNNYCSSSGIGSLDPDVDDLDGDGNTTEELCYAYVSLDINALPALESEKLVKGQLDATWTKYPATGATVPGGLSDYRLIVRNTGNVPIDSVIVIDILPFVGDQGVIDLSNRDSRWRPNLVGAVNAPSGVTVYYSTEGNPCRSAEGIVPSGPVGCSSPGWSTIPPSDISSVQSMKFDFGATILTAGDSLLLEWPMRAPVNVLSTLGAIPDSISWNSFGFIGQRVDNSEYLLASEPVKVGMNVGPAVPGVIGDFVWIDTNQNGIQNGGEPGINGVRVELFLDNGDGVVDPNVDTYQEFTLTADGGYYLFPNLPENDYFLVFYLPPTYEFTNQDIGGNDAIDSDGSPTTYNGFEVAVTSVTNVTAVEYDYRWDQGVYPSGNGAVGNFVWHDINTNDIQDESSADGVNGLVVNLYNNANPGVIYATTISSNDPSGFPGYYLFDDVLPGDYFVEFVLPSSTTFVAQGSTGSSDPTDSDANTTTGRTEVFSIAVNEFDDSWDAGLILSGIEVCNGIDDDSDGVIDENCIEICNDGIDNDGDGDTDCDDSECERTAEINNSGGCANTSVNFTATDAGSGVTYSWDFGSNGTPSSASGIGPHSIAFTNCSDHKILLTVSTGACSFQDSVSYSTRDSIAPVFNVGAIPADVTISCSDPVPSVPTVNASDDCSNPNVVFSEIENQSPDPCGQNNYTIIRTWVATDFCGNAVRGSQTITVEDPSYACSGSGVIGGIAFLDQNNNGLIDDGLDGVSALEVYLYEDNGGESTFVAQTTTDADGRYTFSTGVTSGAGYRVEFVRPSGMTETFTRHGTDNGTNVQFVNAPSCTVNVGLADPDDYCSVQPFMYVPCYSFGPSENNPIDAIVGLPLNPSTGPFENGVIGNAVKHLANAEHVGSVYGLAYSNSKEMLYAASFMKRHVGFGPGGTGAIYQIDPNSTSPGASVLVDLNALFGANTAGADPHPYGDTNICPGCLSAPGTPDNFNCWQYDTLSWDAVGTMSLGDIDISDDGEELFVMNLADKMLYRIDIDNPATTTRYAFPVGDITCLTGGEVRPFAVEFENNKVYVGAICDEIDPSTAMLYVYELNLSTSTWRRVLEANYQRDDGTANNRFRSWIPFDTWGDGSITYRNSSHPILSDISFDNDAMVLAMRDLSGDKFGFEAGRPDRACGVIGHISHGDLFRAGYNSSSDQYTMEFDATVNGITTGGLNSGHGITGTSGYSSYYFEDITPDGNAQITLGGLAQLPGGALYTSAYDVIGLYDFGIAAYDNLTGARIQSYQMATNTNSLTGFGKANGLGDLEFGCEDPPVEIGNRIWYDLNANGIQDVTESGISGITVNLYNSSGDLVGSQVTDALGEYYFSDLTLGDSTLRANDTYYISVGGPEYNPVNNVLQDSLFLTLLNTGQAPNNEINDSDASIGTASDPTWVLDYPFMEVLTPAAGNSEHNWDIGFRSCLLPEIAGVPNDTIVECQGIPTQPVIGTDIVGISTCYDVTITLQEDTIGRSCEYGYTLRRIWIGEDEVGEITRDTQMILVQDTTVPTIAGIPSDTLVDCSSIPSPAVPIIIDNCDSSTDNIYDEVIVYHPISNWSSEAGCSILYEVTLGTYDDKGTPSTADDEMSFVLTVIGKNTGTGWSTTIEGQPYSNTYYSSTSTGVFNSNGSSVSFTITDDASPACQVSVTVNAFNF